MSLFHDQNFRAPSRFFSLSQPLKMTYERPVAMVIVYRVGVLRSEAQKIVIVGLEGRLPLEISYHNRLVRYFIEGVQKPIQYKVMGYIVKPKRRIGHELVEQAERIPDEQRKDLTDLILQTSQPVILPVKYFV